jgi:hypothetical protein
MIKKIILATIFCIFAGVFSSFAQESISSDSLLKDRNKDISPSSYDSIKLQQTTPVILLPKLEVQGFESLLKQQPLDINLELSRNDSIAELILYVPPKFKPYTSFDLGASRWYMPVMGAVTTFSPTINFQATKNLSFYGGISFSQFHNLSYVQSLLAPGWSTKSNIISNGFVGASYRLHDRIILHGSYQRSLYNQLPGNLMMFAPGQNVVVAGASLDVWNGLGVTIDHVWEFDQFGNMRKGFRYSPYIDLQKFIKFLRQ